eukprot:Gb_38359 [translate_table: standard]
MEIAARGQEHSDQDSRQPQEEAGQACMVESIVEPSIFRSAEVHQENRHIMYEDRECEEFYFIRQEEEYATDGNASGPSIVQAQSFPIEALVEASSYGRIDGPTPDWRSFTMHGDNNHEGCEDAAQLRLRTRTSNVCQNKSAKEKEKKEGFLATCFESILYMESVSIICLGLGQSEMTETSYADEELGAQRASWAYLIEEGHADGREDSLKFFQVEA